MSPKFGYILRVGGDRCSYYSSRMFWFLSNCCCTRMNRGLRLYTHTFRIGQIPRANCLISTALDHFSSSDKSQPLKAYFQRGFIPHPGSHRQSRPSFQPGCTKARSILSNAGNLPRPNLFIIRPISWNHIGLCPEHTLSLEQHFSNLAT